MASRISRKLSSLQKFSSDYSPTFIRSYLDRTCQKQPILIEKSLLNSKPHQISTHYRESSISTCANFSTKPITQFLPNLRIINPKSLQTPFVGQNVVRFLSTSNPDQSPTNKISTDNPGQTQELKHQEITGPTVERDLSALANQMKEDDPETVMKGMYSLSNVLDGLGFVHLTVGAWISYTTINSLIPEVSIQSLLAFGLPFSLAFMVRYTLLFIGFSRNMVLKNLLGSILPHVVVKNPKTSFVYFRRVSYLTIAVSSIIYWSDLCGIHNSLNLI